MDLIDRATRALGYVDSPGYRTSGMIGQAGGYSYAFRQAFNEFGVAGVFGIGGEASRASADTYTPLVYVAAAPNREAARVIHRDVWNQGIVPFLLVAMRAEDALWLADGFDHRCRPGDGNTTLVAGDVIQPRQSLPDALQHIQARHLRASIDNIGGAGHRGQRVDDRLLHNIEQLCTRLVAIGGEHGQLDQNVVNALVGRFLYLRFLRDRKILETDHLPPKPGTLPPDASWARKVWACSDRVDEIFNGSIFPMKKEERDRIGPEALALVNDVLLGEADLVSGGLQRAFAEFRFAALRTETLSAVYEMFFEKTDASKKSDSGAVYTPPYLVDYVMAEVDAHRPFRPRDRIFDCAAGSGAFLVGGLRRVIEAHLAEVGGETLSLSTLRGIVARTVWGMERNEDACHVAALGTYLTMLDYAHRDEVKRVIVSRKARPQVFPPLVGHNILWRDFFDTEAPFPPGFPKRVDVVLANPPWKEVSKIGGPVLEYAERHPDVTDAERAAPLFMHRSISDFLYPSGAFGFVMSARALIASAAKHFPSYLVRDVAVEVITNLSDLRRVLFKEAEHPAIVLVGRGSLEAADGQVRVATPSRATLPVASDGSLWLITIDAARSENYNRSALSSADDLIEAMTLRPVDRQILDWLRRSERRGQVLPLSKFLKEHGLKMRRGGSPKQIHLPEKMILSGDKRKKETYYRERLGLIGDLLSSSENTYELSQTDREHLPSEYKKLFSGNIIVFPRSMAEIEFVEQPFAFSSTLNAIYAIDDGRTRPEMMRALSEYLNSSFVEYCAALVGRDWAIDERRFEKTQCLNLPVPLALFEADSSVLRHPKLAGQQDVILDSLQFPEVYRDAVLEFGDIRKRLQNGREPPEEVTRSSLPEERIAYKDALAAELGKFFKSRPNPHVHVEDEIDRYVALVQVDLSSKNWETHDASPTSALAAYEAQDIDVLHCSTWVAKTGVAGQRALVKPFGRVHWTVERAVSDANLLVQHLMSAPLMQDA